MASSTSRSTKDIYIDREVPAEKILSALELPSDKELTKIQRVQLANGEPIAMITNYLISDLVPNIEKHSNKILSLYDFLKENYNIVLSFTKDSITAITADFIQAQILGVPVGSPLLVDTRISYFEDKPFEYVIMIVDANKYSFEIDLVGKK